MLDLAIAFALALATALGAVPLFGALARRVGLVDLPDERRKLHARAVPLVGGIAILAVTLATVAAIYTLRFVVAPHSPVWTLDIRFRPQDALELGGLLVGSLLLLLVGVLDDRFGLRGRQKLLGQILACSVVIAAGYQVDVIEFWGYKFEFGSFAAIISCLWLLGAINSINLLDGADGFAGTIGALMGLSFCIMSLVTNNPVDALITAAMTGAIIGFLQYNLPPARVYLGDAGSMLIGFVFAALAVRCTFKQASAYAFFGPIALLSIPFLDTAAAIVRRRLTGRSIYTVDRAHLHHTLAGHGFGPRRSLILVAILCALTCGGGMLSVIARQSEYAIVSIAAVAVFLVSSRIFGFAEFKLLSQRALASGRNLVAIGQKKGRQHDSIIQLQGSRDWDVVWQNVLEFAIKHDFKNLKLHLHLPWLHEIFHAQYKKPGSGLLESEGEWLFTIPLNVRGQIVGEVEGVAFHSAQVSAYDTLQQMIDMLSDLEPQFVDIMAGQSRPAPPPESPTPLSPPQRPAAGKEVYPADHAWRL